MHAATQCGGIDCKPPDDSGGIAQKAKGEDQEGHACYATRQAHVYSTLAEHAADALNSR